MTLIDDLRGLDLSAIVSARGTITASVGDHELTAIVDGGAAQSALGGIGQALAEVSRIAQDPSSLVSDLLQALHDLGGSLDLGGVDVGELVHAVEEGAQIAAGLIAVVSGEPGAIGRLLGIGLHELSGAASSAASDLATVGGTELARFRSLVETLERGAPREPQALAALVVEALLPAGGGAVGDLRGAVGGILAGAAAVELPGGRHAGLVTALDAVAAAAAGGSTDALRASLAELDRVRASTLGTLAGDLRHAFELVDGLGVGRALEPLTAAAQALHGAEEGVLEFLERVRGEVANARREVQTLDLEPVRALVAGFLATVEQRVQDEFVAPLERQVAALEQWVRDLFAHLPLRALRAEVAQVVHGAARAIEDANLDGPVREARAKLHEAQATIADTDLGPEIHQALQAVEQVVSRVLDAVVGALEAIGEAVDAIAGEAQTIVHEVVQVLTELKDAVEQAKQAVEQLPIEDATRQVVAALHELEQKGEELLSNVHLPDALKPLIDQLLAQLDGIDVEAALLGPVDDALAGFNLLEELHLTDLLAEIEHTIQNLVPAQIGQAIEGEVDQVLDVIRSFRPQALRDAVTHYLADAAQLVDGIDLSPLRDELHRPFQVVLDGVDLLKPSTLLAPVLHAYDEALGGLTGGRASAQDLTQRTLGAIASAGREVGQQVAAPITQLAPQGAAALGAGGDATPTVAGVRPGDAIRLLGFVPAKLHETLRALDASAAGAVLHAVDGLTAGLARDLRALQGELYAVEERIVGALDADLAPLAEAQVRAQLAVHAHFAARADFGELAVRIELDGSLDAVAGAGPGPLRDALADDLAVAAGAARDAAAAAGGEAGSTLAAAAAALDRVHLSSLTGDLDAFLAALDPEPLAAEVDALVAAAAARVPDLLALAGDELVAVVRLVESLIRDLNPAAQLQRFLAVLDVVRDELDVLDPHTLAAELDEVHAAFRAAVAAYDPAGLVDELQGFVHAIAEAVRHLNPAEFLTDADLAFLATAVDRVEAAVPAQALEGVGAELAEVGQQLTAIDLQGLVADVEGVKTRVQEGMHEAVRAVKAEIEALIHSLQYTSANASASASASASVGASA